MSEGFCLTNEDAYLAWEAITDMIELLARDPFHSRETLIQADALQTELAEYFHEGGKGHAWAIATHPEDFDV